MANNTRPRPTPVDHGYAWVMLAACFLLYTLLLGALKTVGILYAEFLVYFQTSAASTAFVPSLAMFLMFGLGPFSNYLCNVYSYRLVMLVGGVLTSIGFVCSAFIPRMEVLYLTYGVIAGTGSGLCFAPTSTIISLYFEKRRALANGIVISGGGLGSIIFPSLFTALIEEYTIRGTLLILGGVLLNMCVAGALFRQPVLESQIIDNSEKQALTEHAQPEADDNELATNVTDQSDVSEQLLEVQHFNINDTKSVDTGKVKSKRNFFDCACCQSVRQYFPDNRKAGIKPPSFDFVLLKNPEYLIFVIAIITAAIAYPINFIMLPAHAESIGLSKYEITVVMSIFGAGELVGRLFFGWFADLKLFDRRYIFVMCMMTTGLSTLIVYFTNCFACLIIYAITCGMFAGSLFSIMAVMLIDMLGIEKLSSSMGLTLLSMSTAVLVGPPFLGAIEDATKSWHICFLISGAMLFVSGLLILATPLVSKCCGKKQNTPKV